MSHSGPSFSGGAGGCCCWHDRGSNILEFHLRPEPETTITAHLFPSTANEPLGLVSIRQTFLEGASWASSGSRTAGSTFGGASRPAQSSQPSISAARARLWGEKPTWVGAGPSLWSFLRSPCPQKWPLSSRTGRV